MFKKTKFLLICLLIMQMFMPVYAKANKCSSTNPWEEYRPKKNEVIFSQEIFKINAIDPSTATNPSGSSFPGVRGANQLVIYTPKFGNSTDTNEYGGEAIVQENTVVSLSGADSLIPKDGFVISGHGCAKKWMNENLMVGTKVSIDKYNKTITAYITSESFIYDAQEKIKEANSMINYYESNLLNYDSSLPKAYISRANYFLKRAKYSPRNVQKYSTLSIEHANGAIASSVPFKESELKGVWIRPTATSRTAIVNTLNDLQKTGINNIFLETFYHGKTIYPSNVMRSYGFTPQYEYFTGFDPLRIWIQEAHKRNIKVNIWFESFYVGNKNPADYPDSVLAKKPEWANVNRRNSNKPGLHPSLSEHNGYFLDPANPEVQDFALALIKEIVINYRPDGINLDYIRYPQSISGGYSGYIDSNWGYTKYAREEFKGLYGIDPYEITAKDSRWDLWCKYRQNKIEQMVQKVSCLCRSNKVTFTAVVFPNLKQATEVKQQNWAKWAQSGLVDGFTPLFLTCDPKTMKQMVNDFRKHICNTNTKLYAGLFVTFMGGAEEDLIRQVHETRKVNLGGVIIFDYAHFAEKYKKILSCSAFDASQCKVSVPKTVSSYKTDNK